LTGPAKILAGLLALVLFATGCSGGSEESREPQASGDELVAQLASYDLAVGTQRFIVGLFTQERDLIGGGEVDLKFAYLGTSEEQTSGALVAETKGTFLPIPTEAGEEPSGIPGNPSIIPSAEGNGVYSTEATFDRPGFWGVVVEADVEGIGSGSARTTFEVRGEHLFPWIGQDAPRSENLLAGAPDVPPTAVDSRAREGSEIPDPGLHAMTVASSIASGKPTLLVVSTPTYCVSRFCGPITDMVQILSSEYSDRANFIHIEVWRDFEQKQVNRAAAEWMLRGEAGLEPWVFLIGPDGKITGRWDNVATRGEVEAALKALIPA
jgi:hypothetical protein